MLDAPLDLCLNAFFGELLLYLVHDPLDKGLTLGLAHIDLVHKVEIDLRLQIPQRQIVHLGLDPGYTKTLGDGRIDVKGLPGLFLLLGRAHILKGAKIMQTVRQLDQDHTDILGHREEHFPEILRLYLHLVQRVLDLSQLRHAVHKQLHLRAEFPSDILVGDLRVFHHVVEKPGRDGLLVQLQLRENDRHAKRVDDIRLPGFSLLILVGFSGQLIGFPDYRKVRGRMVLQNVFLEHAVELLRAHEIMISGKRLVVALQKDPGGLFRGRVRAPGRDKQRTLRRETFGAEEPAVSGSRRFRLPDNFRNGDLALCLRSLLHFQRIRRHSCSSFLLYYLPLGTVTK